MNEGDEILINADGTIEAIYSDDLAEVFFGAEMDIRRASHVEPARDYDTLVAGLADGGGWIADMRPVGGPVLGSVVPFETRQAALDAEVAWLKARMAEGPLEPR